MKFFNPPRILLDPGNIKEVLLGGEVLMIALDLDKNYYNIQRISGSYMRGIFDENLPDQIKDFEFEESDDEANMDPEALANRIVEGLDKIIKQKLIFLGLASFEGNAFNTEVYRTYDISMDDINRLIKKHRVSLERGFPILQKGNFINAIFIGQKADLYDFSKSPNVTDIIDKAKVLDAEPVGIVTSSQGAANFFLLASTVMEKGKEKEYIEKNNLETIRKTMELGQIVPISWFKLNTGPNCFKSLMNWEDLEEDQNLVEKVNKKMTEYRKYLDLLEKTDISTEKFGEVNLDTLSNKERQAMIRLLNDCTLKLDEMAPDADKPDQISVKKKKSSK